jgi:hypothetical protein
LFSSSSSCKVYAAAPAERAAWKKLWEEVDGLLAKMSAPEKRQ